MKPMAAMDSAATEPVGETRAFANWDDCALLQEFSKTRNPEAFAQFAARYGTMVFRTCLRHLRNVHDAEDATQAVFLVLARQPHKALPVPGAWLYGVARRTAAFVLRGRARRARREESVAVPASVPNSDSQTVLRQDLDTGIASLPTRLRQAVILCYLEGRKQEEAARMLGCNQGTLSRWAAEGVERLRGFFNRRHVTVSSAVLVGFLIQQQSVAAASPTLLAALSLAGAAKGSTAAAALAQTVAQSLFVAKVKATLLAVVICTSVVGVGVAVFHEPAPPSGPPGSGWVKTFDDDFSSFDSSKWSKGWTWFAKGKPYQSGTKKLNRAFYSDDNVQVQDGKLVLSARRESMKGFDYTSSVVSTATHFEQAHGYFEARIKYPLQIEGIRPTFWLSPIDAWPPGISVAPAPRAEGRSVAFTNFYRDGGGNLATANSRGRFTFADGPAGDDYHTYAIEWHPEYVAWWVDGVERYRTTVAVPQQKMIIHFAIEMYEDVTRDGDPASTVFPKSMSVAWVRVWKKS